MPPDGYLKTAEIEKGLIRVHSSYPSLTELLELPEHSVEGCTIRTVRIRSGEDQTHGVLLIGGTHACELINPDLLLGLAWKLCFAYANDIGLDFGAPTRLPNASPATASLAPSAPPFPGKRYSAEEIRELVEGLDIFIAPNVNPDGRTYVLSSYDDEWDWRKNLSKNSGGSLGTDLNRNYDFVWEDAIGNTSPIPSNENYRGAKPFSEPETRNVRWLLETYTHITCLADVHSYGEVILHPWSDADNQSNDPSMNFRNPDWDRRRKEAGYHEYIPAADELAFVYRGQRVRDAIAAVRGRSYEVGQSIDLPPLKYTSSGTSKDYAYSRSFIGPAPKIWAYTVETNRSNGDMQDGFSPDYEVARKVMEEVQAGLIQFMLDCLCVVRQVGRKRLGRELLSGLTHFRDDEMLIRRRGRRWADLLDRHGPELLSLLRADKRAWHAAEQILTEAAQIVVERDDPHPSVIKKTLATRIDRLATRLEKRASPDLRKTLATIRKDAKTVTGKNAREAIR
jgi:carboxypeptidase T